jgi:hypothetical protein
MSTSGFDARSRTRILQKLAVVDEHSIRKSFTKDLCLLLKASGCIAVSGGLKSLRSLIQLVKGVTVEQANSLKIYQN